MAKRKKPQRQCIVCGKFVTKEYIGDDEFSYLCDTDWLDYLHAQYEAARKEFGK